MILTDVKEQNTYLTDGYREKAALSMIWTLYSN